VIWIQRAGWVPSRTSRCSRPGSLYGLFGLNVSPAGAAAEPDRLPARRANITDEPQGAFATGGATPSESRGPLRRHSPEGRGSTSDTHTISVSLRA
jgi:hypothetical protein